MNCCVGWLGLSNGSVGDKHSRVGDLVASDRYAVQGRRRVSCSSESLKTPRKEHSDANYSPYKYSPNSTYLHTSVSPTMPDLNTKKRIATAFIPHLFLSHPSLK